MVVSQNEYQTVYEYFLFSLLNKDVIDLRKKINHYAQILALEKIINEDKLDSPLSKSLRRGNEENLHFPS